MKKLLLLIILTVLLCGECWGATMGPISIAALGDDGEYRAGTLYSAGSAGNTAYVGATAGAYRYGLFRFILPAGIPAGSTITSATMSLYSQGLGADGWVDGNSMILLATDSPNAPMAILTGKHPVEAGGETVTLPTTYTWPAITWPAAGNTIVTGNFASIIQALVNKYGGLAPGAHIAVWMRSSTTASAAVRIALYEFGSNPVTMTIDYTAGAGSIPSISRTHKIIQFDGNSMSANTAVTSYPAQAQALFNEDHLENTTYHNSAVAGQTTADMTTRATTYVDANYPINKLPILVAWEMTNDLKTGGSRTDAYNRFKAYCQARKSIGWKVIAVTILPRSEAGVPVSFEDDRLAINADMRLNYLSFCDEIADVAADSRIGDTGDSDNTTYYVDKTHMTAAGYGIVAGIVSDALNRVVTAFPHAPIIIDANNDVVDSVLVDGGDSPNQVGVTVVGTGTQLRGVTTVRCPGGSFSFMESATLSNSIGYGAGSDITIAAGKTVTGLNNLFGDTTKAGAGTYSDAGSTTLWANNPMFIDPGNGNFRLQASSPCIGAGAIIAGIHDQTTPATDADGKIVHFTPNIGAYDGRQSLTLTANYSPTGYEVRGTDAEPAELVIGTKDITLTLSGLTNNEAVKIKTRNKDFTLLTDKAKHKVDVQPSGGSSGMGLW